ncbi:MAG TPA: AraC family transcriptional regulator [Vicinamibacterales bacterium]|nr:AraC family transcriptional regulator [Vicinamibacterales bacterium]
MAGMKPASRLVRMRPTRPQLVQAIGRAVSRFQESSNMFDDLAAEILALHRRDLSCMTMLLFGGAATADEIAAALHLRRTEVSTTLARLQLAGYARAQPGEGSRLELTEHAREWIARIWSPVKAEGDRLLATYSMGQLEMFATFLGQACEVQDKQIAQLRKWLDVPSSARRAHLRGGLSPAALRRVQLFVEANLARPIHLHDLAARASLSPYHFARAFKTSAGMTPRAYVEHRRIEQAKRLLEASKQPLADVAMEVGFGTQSRLTATFRRKTGFTPGEYRRGYF